MTPVVVSQASVVQALPSSITTSVWDMSPVAVLQASGCTGITIIDKNARYAVMSPVSVSQASVVQALPSSMTTFGMSDITVDGCYRHPLYSALPSSIIYICVCVMSAGIGIAGIHCAGIAIVDDDDRMSRCAPETVSQASVVHASLSSIETLGVNIAGV